MGTRSLLTCFYDGDKTKILKIIFSPCLANNSDGDKIPIDMIFGWEQDRHFTNYCVPILVNISDGEKIPIEMFFEWGQDRDFKNYLVPMPSKYF